MGLETGVVGLISVLVSLLTQYVAVTEQAYAVGVPEERQVVLIGTHPSELDRIGDCESGHRLPDGSAVEGSGRHFNADGTVVVGRLNKPEYGVDVGEYQINEVFHGERAQSLGLDLYDEEDNETYAEMLYEEQGAKPWEASANCFRR